MEGDFRIANWLVQPLRDVIESADRSVQLEPKAMDLLVYLAEHQGEVITKERLIQAVWPEAFVTDEVLTNNIWKLRQAFADDPRNPKVIQTVPRRGYQLIAEVILEEAAEESSRYEIQKELGKGAMGEVHLAKDLLLGRQLALKFLPSEMEEDKSLRRRLFREARAAAALDQPFICKVYDTGQMEGRTFIALEYVKGQTLKERLKEGPFSVGEALRVVAEVAEALQAAHEESIVHRDIKPSNIMLTDQGHVKVMDFGVAKKLPTADGDQEWTATLTTDASSMGTLPYMSPEQIRGQPVDARTDIFSLGVVLYEMVTGVHPFRRPLSADTAAVILSEGPPALSQFCKHVPAALQDLLAKMLAKDREDRCQSVRDIYADLDRLTTQQQSISSIEILKRSGTKLAVTGLVLVTAVSIAALVFWSPWTSSPTLPPTLPVPLTSHSGIEGHPALSPDGTYVAFSWDGEEQDNFDIYVQPIGTTEPHRLTTDPAEDSYPTWSPNGSQIAFLRKVSRTEHSVFVRPVLGGTETRVADSTFEPTYYSGGGLSWSPLDQIIAMVDRVSTEEPNSIYLLSLESGEKRKLTFPAEGEGDDWPTFSPDGTKVAFLRTDPFQLHIFVQEVHGDEARKLTTAPLFVRGLDWTSDGSAIVVSFSKTFSQDSYLARVPIVGDEPERLPFGEGAEHVSIARTGGRLAYERFQSVFDIWRASGPESAEVVPPARFPVSSTRAESLPEYSPDGTKIALVSDRSGEAEIWLSAADGTELHKLTDMGFAIMGAWSPSGETIAFAATEGGTETQDIFVVKANGGLPRNLTPDKFFDYAPSWSIDGNSIYYSSERDGAFQICKTNADGGDIVQLTENGGRNPWVVEDGRVLFWRENRIWSLPRNGGQESLILDKEIPNIFNWCPWRENIVYFTENTEGEPLIEMLDLRSGEPKELHSFGMRTDIGSGITVSPDGEWILYTQVKFSSDLMLVENFY